MLVLQDEHVAVTCGVTFGLPSRSPPIQVPKRSGARSAGRSTPERGQLVGQVLEHVADGVQHQLVEVVGGVARLVERLGPVQAQLVGLPEQVDDLGDPAVGPRVVRRRLEQVGDPPALGQDRRGGPPRSGAR